MNTNEAESSSDDECFFLGKRKPKKASSKLETALSLVVSIKGITLTGRRQIKKKKTEKLAPPWGFDIALFFPN